MKKSCTKTNIRLIFYLLHFCPQKANTMYNFHGLSVLLKPTRVGTCIICTDRLNCHVFGKHDSFRNNPQESFLALMHGTETYRVSHPYLYNNVINLCDLYVLLQVIKNSLM